MATTLNRTFFGGSTAPGSGVYPEDLKSLKVFRNYAETEYDPLADSDTSVYIPTVERVDSSGTNIHVTIQKILASGGYPVLIYHNEEYQYVMTGGSPSKYVFMCLSDLSTFKRAEVDVSTGAVAVSSSTTAAVQYIGRSSHNIFHKISNAIVQNTLPVIVDDSKYYQLSYAWNGMTRFTRVDETDGTLHILSIDSDDTITETVAPAGANGTVYPSLQSAIADASNLEVGAIFETNGFHTSGDGGAARYVVSNTGTANGMDVISLGDGKLGVLQNDKYIDVQQLGAFGDNDHDDSDVLQYAVNISAGTERPVLLTKSYKITKVIYITSSTTIIGQSSKTTSIWLYNNSRLELKRDTGDKWVYEVRMRGFCIFANDVSDFCIASNYVASQCFFEDIYMDHASVACVKIRGSLLYFEGCYFFYSPVGVQLRGNAINFENCNFWEADTAFKCYDDTGVTFLNLSHCWIEHSHRVFDTNGNHIACFAVGTAFQGSTTAGYKVLDPINGDNANVNLSFIQCRFAYPNETGYLFKVITKTIGAGGNSLLKFSNCYVSIPAADYLIDNSAAAIGTLGVVYESSSPIDNVFSNEGTRGSYMGPLMDFRHFTMFNSGLVIGDLKPSLDEVIALRTGYMRYDTYNGQLQCVDNNGTQRGIPWKTSTYLPRLFKNQNDLAKDVDDVREKLNDLIYILKYQGKMLQPGNQDGSLSTVVKIGENDYPVIKIGNYYWLAEDLHEPLGEEGVDYVINNNGDYLYKWSALCSSSGVESPGLLAIKPLSWKMPYDVNWTNLMDSLVGDTKAEKAATLYGVDVFTGFSGNNSTGFSSNANGYYNGSFVDEGVSAKYHSSNANGDLTSVGIFSLSGDDYSYSNTGSSASFRSCRLCMRI